ncbi:unnamed protein product, partial [Prorocentrum cordatum]
TMAARRAATALALLAAACGLPRAARGDLLPAGPHSAPTPPPTAAPTSEGEDEPAPPAEQRGGAEASGAGVGAEEAGRGSPAAGRLPRGGRSLEYASLAGAAVGAVALRRGAR